MDEYLSKPLDSEQLEVILQKWRHPRPVKSETTSEQLVDREIKISNDCLEPCIDMEYLMHSFGHTGTLTLLSVLLRQLPADMQKLQLDFSLKEAKSLERRCHRLRGLFCTVGATRLTDICTKLEESSKANCWENTEQIILIFQSDLADLIEFIENQLSILTDAAASEARE